MTTRARVRGRVVVAVAALLAVLAARPAAAWLPDGHMATGALAFDALSRRDPDAVAAVVALMPAHPDWPRFLENSRGLTGPAWGRRVFELMARWPDDARGGPLDHDDWHYSQKVASGMRFVLPMAFGGAERAFRRNLRTARDPRARPAERAVALCWVMHIVGDMHQPLHAALWMSLRFPITDRGGNSAWVRPSEAAAPERLHWFWDSAGGAAGVSLASPVALEARLEREHPDPGSPPPADADGAFADWVAASRALARGAVYEDGALRAGTSPRSAPVLTPGYVADARGIAARRLAEAGHRIGALFVGVR